MRLPTFEDRYKYLRIGGKVGEDTFGFDRYLNQILYRSNRWKDIRREVIIRDHGCDLACYDREIPDGIKIYVHHMNPITKQDILEESEFLTDPEYLITTIKRTHDAIHYGDDSLIYSLPKERSQNDTCPWRQEEIMKDEKIVEHIEEVVVEPEEKIEEGVAIEPEETPVEVESVVKGKVTNCVKLNVRRGSDKTSGIREVIEEGAIVEINEKRSTDDWYSVCTESGTKGFCMKEYITKLP